MDYEFYYNLENEIQIANMMLSDLGWFREKGYEVCIPKGIDGSSGEDEIKNAVGADFIANKSNAEKLKNELNELVDKNKESLANFFSNFDYTVPSSIKIYLTNYGSGGSYHAPNEIIVLMNGPVLDLFRTIIHETVHLIIEEPFVQKNSIAHWQKELIVDILCSSSLLEKIYGKDMKQKINEKLPIDLMDKLKFKDMASLDYESHVY